MTLVTVANTSWRSFGTPSSVLAIARTPWFFRWAFGSMETTRITQKKYPLSVPALRNVVLPIADLLHKEEVCEYKCLYLGNGLASTPELINFGER